MTAPAAGEPAQQVREAVERFLSPFERGDIAAMEAAFARDATAFPRSVMASNRDFDIDLADFRRVRGMDPQMREIAAQIGQRPALRLEPRDLEVRLYGRAAVVTFHLDGDCLGRRTLVLAACDGEWKIVHLHASNVEAPRR